MRPHVSVMTMRTIGSVTISRRLMKRNLSRLLLRFYFGQLVRGHVGNARVPLRAVVLDVDVLPRVERPRIRVHTFNVGLLHPARRVDDERDDGLLVEEVAL